MSQTIEEIYNFLILLNNSIIELSVKINIKVFF